MIRGQAQKVINYCYSKVGLDALQENARLCQN